MLSSVFGQCHHDCNSLLMSNAPNTTLFTTLNEIQNSKS